MTPRVRSRRRPRAARFAAAALSGVLGAVLAGAPAWAYFRAGVSGSVARTLTSTNVPALTVSITGSSVAKLFPAGPAGDLTFSVTNNTTRSVAITGISSITGSATGCTTPDISAVQPVAGQLFSVAANTTLTTKTFSAVVAMGSAASSDCQGKTLTITMTLIGKY